MITDMMSESELKRTLALWMLKYNRLAIINPGSDVEDFIDDFRIPDVNFVHTQSVADAQGNLITLLKAEITLRDWETKSGRKHEKFVFYKILKTFNGMSDIEPYPMGYIAVYD